MRMYLQIKGFLTYGAFGIRGKVQGGLLAVSLLFAAPVMAQQTTLVAFGDSLTQGYGLMDHEGFVAQLRDWLKGQNQEVRVINAGVSGDTTSGGLARIDWTLTADIEGMILALGGNDLLRGTDPALVRSNIDRIMAAAEAKGVKVLLVGMQAPGNYGPEYKAQFDSIWPEIASKYNALLVPSFFEGLGGTDPAEVKDLFQTDGIHPNGEGVKRIVAAMGPHVLELIGQIR